MTDAGVGVICIGTCGRRQEEPNGANCGGAKRIRGSLIASIQGGLRLSPLFLRDTDFSQCVPLGVILVPVSLLATSLLLITEPSHLIFTLGRPFGVMEKGDSFREQISNSSKVQDTGGSSSTKPTPTCLADLHSPHTHPRPSGIPDFNSFFLLQNFTNTTPAFPGNSLT